MLYTNSGRKVFGVRTWCAVKGNDDELYQFQFHKMVWIFTISSVVGVVLEVVFCLVFKGYLESRQGVLYGPFNQVYGLGAVVLSLVLLNFRGKGIAVVFCVSALIGGLFEAVCSFVQEIAFGTVSWDYSWMPISLFGGRTNILYMLFFGVLGVVFLYLLFPLLSRLSDRIHTGKGVLFTWFVVCFMSVNLCLSAVVVARWSQRQAGAPAANAVDSFVDTHYPDDLLARVFPSMVMAGRR